MEEKNYKVYRYTFPDGRVYIGTTKNTIQHRKDCGYQHNARLTEAIRTIGWESVQKDILADGLTQSEAFAEEERQIKAHDSTDQSKGYNVSFGGKNTFHGLHHKSEHRAKMSRLYKGRTFSEETLRKMNEAHEKERQPVESLDENGNVTAVYKSKRDAAVAVGGYASNISRSCASGREYKGMRWRNAVRKEVV